MELDKSAKVASIASVLVGALVSLTAWYTNIRIQGSQDNLASLIQKEKEVSVKKSEMELRKTEIIESSRVVAGFSVPMARSFALQYEAWLFGKPKGKFQYVVPDRLSPEIMAMWPSWADRKGLMTGKPCEAEGLLARQVVLLDLQNEGRGDAIDVRLEARLKRSPSVSPSTGWREGGARGPLAYSELGTINSGWEAVELRLPDLAGSAATDATRMGYRVVLASVSGRTVLYGTVIVPVSVSWQDRMTQQRHKEPVLEPNAAILNAELTGAEIGQMRDLCAKARAG